MEKVYSNTGKPRNPVRTRADKLLDEIINQIAREEQLTPKRINVMLQSIFGTIADDIRSGTLKGTHLVLLGKFIVKPYNIQKYHNKQNNIDGNSVEN